MTKKGDNVEQTFYTITGLGWGKGETPDEAETNYRNIQKRNFPHLTDEDLDDVWGFTWKPPAGTEGFSMDLSGHLRWRLEDDTLVPSEKSQRVRPVGNVPEEVL